MSWEVRAEPYDGPIAQQMIDDVQAEYVIRYGDIDKAPVNPEEFAPPRGLLLVGLRDETPVAMGGFRLLRPGLAEIKRMYVPTAYRRQGLSRLILTAIEDAARDVGCTEVWLNTGTEQPEAMRLYETSGYTVVPGFGHYADAPKARFYGKTL